MANARSLKTIKCSVAQEYVGASAGFTLIEMLVVIAIMGAMLAMGEPLLEKFVPGAKVRQAASDIASELRRAHSDALAKEQEIDLELADRSYGRSGEKERHFLPPAVSFGEISVPSDNRNQELTEFRFFPDGSASTGQITVQSENHKTKIAVNWLTGRVSVDEQ